MRTVKVWISRADDKNIYAQGNFATEGGWGTSSDGTWTNLGGPFASTLFAGESGKWHWYPWPSKTLSFLNGIQDRVTFNNLYPAGQNAEEKGTGYVVLAEGNIAFDWKILHVSVT